jgi:hypothetical protein
MNKDNIYKEVRFASKEQLESLKRIHKSRYGTNLQVTTRDDFKNWDKFLKGCLSTFIILCTLTIMGLLALYVSVLAGYIERIPTLEDFLFQRIADAIQAAYPTAENAFFNIEAGCVVDALRACQVQLINPFEVVDG